MTEPSAKALFVSYGIPVTREKLASSADTAVAAAQDIGFPVVMKGVSQTVVHKSDSGLVRLNLVDEPAVREAYAAVHAALGDAEDPVVSMQEMIRGEAEMIVGTRRDETFGAQLVVGFGGTLVEVRGDVQVCGAPLSAAGAHAMLRRLRFWPLLDGVRGRPKLDVAALADVMVRLSYLAHDLGDRLVDLETNPVIVCAEGRGVCAVDGRGTVM